MYVPKHYHWLAPFGAIITTFGINQQVLGGGFHWDYALLVQLPISILACSYGIYLEKAGVAYQNYVTGAPLPNAKPIEAQRTTVPLYVEGQPRTMIYNQVTAKPVMDAERNVAKTLIDQRNHNLEINLKEEYWIKGGRFGESREAFANMREKWMYHKIIERAGERKNAPFVVCDWRALRLVADGQKLPPPPSWGRM